MAENQWVTGGYFSPISGVMGPYSQLVTGGPTLQVISSVGFSATGPHPSAEGQLLDESFDVVRSFGAWGEMGSLKMCFLIF